MDCPSCSNNMLNEQFEGNYGTQIELDICHTCNAIWFDKAERLRLTPGSVIKLFKSMHENQSAVTHPLKEHLSCPRCQRELKITYDIQRGTRFNYSSCPLGCGHFITFFQWLREKNMVRDLDTKQINTLRAHFKVIRCSNCGASVDIQRHMKCEYCHTAIASFDPSTIEQTLKQLQLAENKRTTVDPQAIAQLLNDRLAVDRLCRTTVQDNHRWQVDDWKGRGGLVEIGLSVLFDILF